MADTVRKPDFEKLGKATNVHLNGFGLKNLNASNVERDFITEQKM